MSTAHRSDIKGILSRHNDFRLATVVFGDIPDYLDVEALLDSPISDIQRIKICIAGLLLDIDIGMDIGVFNRPNSEFFSFVIGIGNVVLKSGFRFGFRCFNLIG